MNDTATILSRLQATIAQRRSGDPTTSYVAKRFAKGRAKMAQKIGEEGVELAIALVQGERTDIIGESADLLFHLLIALEDADISFTEVLEALAQREGTSGIEEKRARGG